MTSLSLLLWIILGIVLQLAIAIGLLVWRQRQKYHALRSSSPDQVLPIKHGVEETGAWQGFRPLTVTRKLVEDADGSICSFHLATADGAALPAFSPGQFLTFRLDVPMPTGGTEQLIRCYSLSDAPNPASYRVSIKRVPPPAGSSHRPGRSSTYFHDHVEVGTRLQVRAPSGHFHIERSADPVVLIAGGVGITPMLSMLNWCLAEQPGREIWLFYGVRHGRELAMRAVLEAQAKANPHFHLWRCFSDPLSDDEAGRDFEHAGRVDIRLLRTQLPLKPYQFYICGPAPMMESLVPALGDWGVPDERVHFEAFGPASIKRKQPEQIPRRATGDAITVSFARSGRQLPWQPSCGSLLEFAEANGVTVDSGCRAGGCGTCQTHLRSGEVDYRQPPDFDPEPGSCLLCVCTPKSSVALEL